MDDSKLEPQPEEGDINNNSETLDRAMLVSMHTLFTARRAHQELRALPPHTQSWPPGAHTNLSKGHTNLSKSQP